MVSIRVEQKNQQVVLLVENPYRETASDERHSGNQMALENIVHRLQALYGDKVQFTSGLVDQRYRTCLSYPDQSEHRRV